MSVLLTSESVPGKDALWCFIVTFFQGQIFPLFQLLLYVMTLTTDGLICSHKILLHLYIIMTIIFCSLLETHILSAEPPILVIKWLNDEKIFVTK